MQTFFVEPEIAELATGETKEIRVWAFPTDVKTYKVRVLVRTAEQTPEIVNANTSAHSEPYCTHAEINISEFYSHNLAKRTGVV